jgi:hypothetical protein
VVNNADYRDWATVNKAMAGHIQYRNGPHADQRLLKAERRPHRSLTDEVSGQTILGDPLDALTEVHAPGFIREPRPMRMPRAPA